MAAGLAFVIDGIGALGCIPGDWWSQNIGSALAFLNAIGIDMLSIHLGTHWIGKWGGDIAWLLLPGPLLGLLGLWPLWKKR